MVRRMWEGRRLERGFRMSFDQIVQVHIAVSVNVNGADAATAHRDLSAFACGARLPACGERASEAAIHEAETRGRCGDCF